jgi:hypothetical protein
MRWTWRGVRDVCLWAGLVVAVCLAIFHSAVLIFHAVTNDQPTSPNTVVTSLSYQEPTLTSSEEFQDWADPVNSLVRSRWEIFEVDYRKDDNTVRILAVKRLPEDI